ncbi:MAG TPA: tripartite tricarboxylate transporter permease [Chloroflexota bacterium]|nr:tripartite tricarboxylate transporter permease [Chloroflexota bacterium]
MEVIQNLAHGLMVAMYPSNLVACFIGVLIGTLVGILPGLGPAATLAMLLPMTFGMGATTSMIMLAGVFYGSKYGGAITSVLVNLPGESSSLMTCMDGYPMARKGRAGPALGMSAIASFFAGTVGVIGLMLVAPPLADLALNFGPPEYFALMCLGLTLVTFLAGKSMVKALIMGCVGLILSTVGSDTMSGSYRLWFGQPFLLGGVDFVVAAMGLFAVGEILMTIEEEAAVETIPSPKKLSELLPSFHDIRECWWTLVRSTLLGFLIGTVPGGNPTIATFLSYGATKAIAKDPEVFGSGTIRGVAASESADNAATSGGMVPLLTLGVPGTASTAILLGALIMAGLQPGPLLMQQEPELFWATIASMYIGNVLLLIMNLPLVPVFASLIRVPYFVLYPMILAICSVGVYSLDNKVSDVGLMAVFGIIGYLMKKAEFPAAPLVLALVLGGMIEKSLRQSLTLFEGDLTVFFQRPLCAVLLTLTVVMLLLPVVRGTRKRPAPVPQQ